jgi:hypothetical protein
VFVSKIWFFVVAVIAAVALSLALVMPRPAERVQSGQVEPERVAVARTSVSFLLAADAREGVDLAAVIARAPGPSNAPLALAKNLEAMSAASEVPPAVYDATKATLQFLLGQVVGSKKPEFLLAVDDTGRVAARVGLGDEKGDDMSRVGLVQDALRGYLRDDLWWENDKLYRVTVSPCFVPGSDGRSHLVGAVILGDQVDLDLVRELEKRIGHCDDKGEHCEPHVAFFMDDQIVVGSDSDLVGKDVLAGYQKAKAAAAPGKPLAAFDVKSGNRSILVAVQPLPGTTGERGGYYAVYAPRSAGLGFAATLGAVKKDDIAFGHFPWIPLVIAFVLITALGLAFMWLESDRPLKRLLLDAVALGKGEASKLAEDRHKGRFGSIARSVNIALEKLEREARERRKDLGAVLGPAPDEGGGLGKMGPSPFASGSPFGGDAVPFGTPAPQPAPFRFETAPPPMHLPPAGAPPGKAALPAGPGFAFDLPEVRPATPAPLPEAKAPPAKPAARPTLPVASRGKSGNTPPPLPPPLPSSGPTGRRPTTPSPALAAIDEDILDVDSPARPDLPRISSVADFGGETVVANPSEDLLQATIAAADGDAAYFREVFDDFVELKQKCGETTDGLTYEKFAGKLRGNREQLVKKYGCKSVTFQVYVKDGKAALKATPVKG